MKAHTTRFHRILRSLFAVLYLAMSPDGETIVTGAGDETLRFWNAFPRQERGRGIGGIGVDGESEGGKLDYGRLIR